MLSACGYSSHVIAGKRMFEIGRGGQRGDYFVWKVLSQHLREARAELLSSQRPYFRTLFRAYELEFIRPSAAETHHVQLQPPGFICLDGTYAANKCGFRRPQMQQDGAALLSHFVLEILERCEP